MLLHPFSKILLSFFSFSNLISLKYIKNVSFVLLIISNFLKYNYDKARKLYIIYTIASCILYIISQLILNSHDFIIEWLFDTGRLFIFLTLLSRISRVQILTFSFFLNGSSYFGIHVLSNKT